MPSGNIFIVTAPSGAGKTTLVNALLAADSTVQLSISYTTRAMRVGEVNGKDYHFVSRAEFESMIANGDFLESAEVYGNYYGTSHAWIRQALQSGQDILLEIDGQGARQVRNLFPEAVSVFIVPPSPDVLAMRLRGRGTDSEEVIEQRLRCAAEEMQHLDEFDFVIVNELIDAAVRDILAIVRAERLKISYQTRHKSELISALKSMSALGF